jgi:hypothetical protein
MGADRSGHGPNYLAREAVTYGRAHPADPRVPEALALAVRATRFGSTDKNATSWSRSAFTGLGAYLLGIPG